MRDDIDDLIGGGDDTTVKFRASDVHEVMGGVSVAWLMKAFRMGRGTIEMKLRGCQPVARGKNNTPLYDLPEAASYLIKPRGDIEKFIAGLKPDELPDRIRESYWNAKLKQQRFEERASTLWRADRVVGIISELLQDIRTKVTIIPDIVDRSVGLNNEQVRSLTEVIDDVQNDIYQHILSLKDNSFTPNALGEENEDEDI